LVKLVVFTPISYVQQVVDALSKAGAGHIGNYSHCTFQSAGTGTFKPLDGTTPFIGKQGEVEHVEEMKIETIVPEKNLHQVIEVMSEAHPYEKVAYEIIPLKNEGETLGIGRIGSLKEEMTLLQLINVIKTKYGVDYVRFVGDQTQRIKRVAILGGSGEKYIEHAINAGADVYITGDMTFHHAQDAKEEGLSIIDPGHYIEKIMKQATQQYIQAAFPQLKVIKSAVN